MRYAIGVEVENKYNHQKINNLYCFGAFGLDYLINKNNKEITTRVVTFKNLEDAQLMLSYLARHYRRNDVAYTLKKKSLYIKKWYLIKLDSLKSPIKLTEWSSTGTHKYQNKLIETSTYYFDFI